MTTEHENGERDDLVSKTYRELHAERTPENLNQRILQMASQDTKRGGAGSLLSAGWMKPVAWAATIGLSLAIVLELTQVPMTELPRAETPLATSPALESVSDDFIAKEKQALGRAEEKALRQSNALQQEAREDEFLPNANDPVVENKAMRRPAVVVAEPAESGPAPVVDQAAARKRSADQAMEDISSARDNVAVEGIAAFAASAAIIESDRVAACDPKTRSSADDWLACIEDLRSSGAIEMADLEYDAYILEYPPETEAN